MTVKLLKKHSKDCAAVKHWPSNPWAYLGSSERQAEPTPAVLYLDFLGRRTQHGRYRWLTVGCNCTGCPAVLAIREADILSAAQEALNR